MSVGLCFFEGVKAVGHRWKGPALGLGSQKSAGRGERVRDGDAGSLLLAFFRRCLCAVQGLPAGPVGGHHRSEGS